MRRLAVVGLLVMLLLGCSPGEDKLWISGWQETSSMNEARAGAAVIVHNNFIYMIAGVDGRNFLRTTEFAPILPDGSLGAWQYGPSLIEERGFTEAVVRNGYIYVVGGGNGPNGQHLLRSVERARINDDGSLGPWQQEASQTVLPRRCTKLSLIGDYVYSFGGFGGTLLDSVEFARIADDGSVGEWKMASETMTLPRYVNSVKAMDGFAFVIGGHDQQKGVGITDVEWARPAADGDIRGWQKTSPMITGRYGLASAKKGKSVYALGGLTGLEYLGSVEKAELKSEGGLSAWQETTAMTSPRATFSTVVEGDRLYVLGGTNRDGYLRSVEFTTINKQGDLGFWGNEAQRVAHEARLQKQASASPSLPNRGVIKQVLHAQMYTYLQVLNQENQMVWLAGPRTELPVNTTIYYSKGVYMTNFYSKELKRAFPAVTFVSRIEVAK